MDKKIAEIVCRAACEFESPESMVACRKRCNGGGCVPMIEAKQAILALIASEQKPMVEALKEARKDLETIQSGEGPYNRDPLKHLENCYEHMIETAGNAIAKIDAVLKGEGE